MASLIWKRDCSSSGLLSRQLENVFQSGAETFLRGSVEFTSFKRSLNLNRFIDCLLFGSLPKLNERSFKRHLPINIERWKIIIINQVNYQIDPRWICSYWFLRLLGDLLPCHGARFRIALLHSFDCFSSSMLQSANRCCIEWSIDRILFNKQFHPVNALKIPKSALESRTLMDAKSKSN